MGVGPLRGFRAPKALRRMRAHRSVLAAVALTVLLTAAFAAALAAYSGQAGTAAVRDTLSRDPRASAVSLAGSAPDGTVARASADLRGQLSKALGGVGVTLYPAPELESIVLPGSTRDHGRLATLLAPSALSAHARLVSGSWPRPYPGAADGSAGAAGSTRAPVPVAVGDAAAARLGLHVGSVLRTHTASGVPVAFTVAGVFSPRSSQDPFWNLDPFGGAGFQTEQSYETFGPFYTDPSYMSPDSSAAGGAVVAQQMEWEAVPDVGAFGTSGLSARGLALGDTLRRMADDTALGDPQASTGLVTLLGGLSSAVLVAQSLVFSELLELLVVAAAALFVVVRLLTETREAEAALLWARGGTGPQLLRLRTVEALLLAVPALIVAPFAARPLAAQMGRLGAAGGSPGFPSRLDGAATAAVWVTAVAAALVAMAVILGPALTSAVSPLALRARSGRQSTATAVGRAGFDLALVALAGAACWQLLARDSIVGVDLEGNASYSPVAIAAPALTLAAGAVLVLRLLPLPARLGDLLARRGRSLVTPLALWQTARRPLKLAGPVLLTMLAVAAGVLSLTEYASAGRSAADQAAFTAGSDVDAQFPSGSLTPADLAALTASPGVSAVSQAYREDFSPGQEPSREATLLGVDPASAARTLLMRPDLSPVPLSTLMGELSAAPAGDGSVPGVATSVLASALRLGVGDTTSVPFGDATLRVRIVAVVAGFPTVDAASGGLVVSLPAATRAAPPEAGDATAVAPDEVWLRDSAATAPRGLPDDATVVSRAQLATRLRSAPLAEEPIQALLAVAIATVLLALCGMVVGVLSTSGERSVEFALLDALGFSRRGRIGLRCLEQALLAVPGALAGIALGLLLGRVVVPVATLTAAAGRPQPPVTVLTPWTAVALGVAVVLAVPLLTAALAARRRQRTAAVLRTGVDR